MSNRDIGKLYSESVSRKKFDTISDRFNEATVVVKYEDGTKAKFKLEDAYAKAIQNRIQVDTNNVDEYIQNIMINGNWGITSPGTAKSMREMKEIVINTQYDKAIDLVAYLSKNKSKLLSLKQLHSNTVVNFADVIIESLPDEFKTDRENLYDFIAQLHRNIKPGAATGVGLGEGTFSIFGTATKGSSGDLKWDGQEVEIKTNGYSDAEKKIRGAILGGDGTFNKVGVELEKLKPEMSDRYRNRYVSAMEALDQLVDQIVATEDKNVYTNLIKRMQDIISQYEFTSLAIVDKTVPLSKTLMMVKSPGDFQRMIKKTDMAFRASGGTTTLYQAVKTHIQQRIEKLGNMQQGWSSQINTYLSLAQNEEEIVAGFNAIRSYNECDMTSELKQFFTKRNSNDFLPEVNYINFKRLVGAISIRCYHNKLGFDILTAGNDVNMTMAFIKCTGVNLTGIYDQLESVPSIDFDLEVDTQDLGTVSARTQTSIAKSPRIQLK